MATSSLKAVVDGAALLSQGSALEDKGDRQKNDGSARMIDPALKTWATGLALGCAALSASPAIAKPAPTARPPAATTSVSEQALRTTIDGHYARYRYINDRDIPARFRKFQNSPALQALFNRVGGGLDYDVYCGCQEYEESKFRYSILSMQVTGPRAVVAMQVFPFYTDDPRRITLKFLRNARGVWQVDDVADSEHKSLQASLRAMRPGALRVE